MSTKLAASSFEEGERNKEDGRGEKRSKLIERSLRDETRNEQSVRKMRAGPPSGRERCYERSAAAPTDERTRMCSRAGEHVEDPLSPTILLPFFPSSTILARDPPRCSGFMQIVVVLSRPIGK